MPVLNISKFLGLNDSNGVVPTGFLSKCDNLLISPNDKLSVRQNFTGVRHFSKGSGEYVVKMFTAFEKTFLISSIGKLYWHDESGGVFTEILGPQGYNAFGNQLVNVLGEVSIISFRDVYILKARKFAPIVLYRKGASDFRILAAGLPTVGISGWSTYGTVGSYLFTTTFSYTFSTYNGVIYIIEGPPAPFITLGNANLNAGATVGGYYSSAFLEAANSPLHYPAPNDGGYKVNLYRSESYGQVLRLWSQQQITNVPHTLPSINASTSGQPILYTDSGEVGNDILLGSASFQTSDNVYVYTKNLAITSDSVAWALVQDKGLLRHSKAGAPWSWPISYDFPVQATAQCIAAIGKSIVVFHNNKTERVDGFLDNTGIGNISSTTISNSIGCANFKNLIEIDNRVYFFFNGMLYMTGGSEIVPLVEHFTIPSSQSIMQIDWIPEFGCMAVLTSGSNVYSYYIDPSMTKVVRVTVKTNVDAMTAYGSTGIYISSRYNSGTDSSYISKMSYETDVESASSVSTSNDVLRPDSTEVPFFYDFSTCNIDFGEGAPSVKWTPKIFLSFVSKFRNSGGYTGENFCVQAKPYIVNDLSIKKYMPSISYRSEESTGTTSGTRVATVEKGNVMYKRTKRNVPNSTLRGTFKKFGIVRSHLKIVGSPTYAATRTTFGEPETIRITGLTQAAWQALVGTHYVGYGFPLMNYLLFIKDAQGENTYSIQSITFDGTGALIQIHGQPYSGNIVVDEWSILGHRKYDKFEVDSIAVEFTVIGQGYKDVKEDG